MYLILMYLTLMYLILMYLMIMYLMQARVMVDLILEGGYNYVSAVHTEGADLLQAPRNTRVSQAITGPVG